MNGPGCDVSSVLDADGQAVSDAFGLGRVHCLTAPVARGEVGEVRRLETQRGRWAVKTEFEPGAETANESSMRFHHQCWAAGVSTPEPIRSVDGPFVAEVSGQPLRLFAWEDLDEPDTDLDPVAVGGLLAALHAVRRAPTGPVNDWFQAPIGASQWESVLDASRAAGAPYADRLAELLPALIDVESILTPMAGSQTCHLDLWSDNLRRTTSGKLSVIDFDNCGPADPSRELAMVIFEFGGGDPLRHRALLDAYARAGGPGRVKGRDSFALTVAQLNHIGHRHLRMWVAAEDSAARDRSRAGVEEFLSEPFLLAGVDEMVADLAAIT